MPGAMTRRQRSSPWLGGACGQQRAHAEGLVCGLPIRTPLCPFSLTLAPLLQAALSDFSPALPPLPLAGLEPSGSGPLLVLLASCPHGYVGPALSAVSLVWLSTGSRLARVRRARTRASTLELGYGKVRMALSLGPPTPVPAPSRPCWDFHSFLSSYLILLWEACPLISAPPSGDPG